MDYARNLGDLHLLVQVIEANGFSAAARRTGMTRSLLSRRIIELERRLDVRLLHRNARSFAVTAVGEQVYRHAVAMCDAARAASTAASESIHGGQVRVAASGLLSPLLGGLLADFGMRHPQIHLSMTSYRGGIDALLQQHADVILSSAGSLPDSSDVVARPLAGMRMVVVASPALLQQLDQPSHPGQVQDRHCLGYVDHGLTQTWNLRGVAERRLHNRLTTDNLPTLLGSARAGMGLAQLPLYACHDDLAAGRLQLVFESFEARPLTLHALTMQGNAVGEITHGFIQFVRQSLADMQLHGILPTAPSAT